MILAGQIGTVSASLDLPESIDKEVQIAPPWRRRNTFRWWCAWHWGVGPITSDRGRVEQILLNLLSNTLKFAESGEVVVEAKREDVMLKADREARTANLAFCEVAPHVARAS